MRVSVNANSAGLAAGGKHHVDHSVCITRCISTKSRNCCVRVRAEC